MKKETLNAIVNALNSASTDVTRPQIGGVLVRPASMIGVIEVIATNGACLSKNALEDKGFYETLKAICSKGVYLPAESVKALKALKVKTPVAPSQLNYSSLSVTVNGQTTSVMSVPQDVALAGNNAHLIYPDVNQVIPNYSEENSIRVGFDADLLSKIVDALKENKKSPGRIIFEIPMTGGPQSAPYKDKPYLIKLGAGMELGVLMPTRI